MLRLVVSEPSGRLDHQPGLGVRDEKGKDDECGEGYSHVNGIGGGYRLHDGKSVVSAGLDGTVRTWKLADDYRLTETAVLEADANWVEVSPDGSIVAAGGYDTWQIKVLPAGEVGSQS